MTQPTDRPGDPSVVPPRHSTSWLVAGAGLAVAVLVADTALTFRNTQRLHEDTGRVARTHEVISGLQHVLALATDAETGQRGYLLTGEPRYLTPYTAAAAAIAAQVDEVERLTADNPAQRDRLPELRQRVAAKLGELEQTIALRDGAGGFDAARRVVLTGRGQQEMDAVRATVGDMVERERGLRRERLARSDRAYRWTVFTGLLSGLAAVAAFAFFLQLLRRHLAARAAAAAVIAEQGERLRTTLASIGDAVITTDTAGRVTGLNRVAVALTGWTNAEAVGQPLEVVFHIVNESTRRRVESPVTKALREGTVVGLANHTVLIAKGGAERPIDDSAAPIRRRDGEVVGCVLVFRDITEHKRLESQNAERMQSARLLAAIVESSDDAVISKTLDGTIRTWNAAAERLFGYTAEQAVGRPITMLIPPDRLGEEERIIARVRAGERFEHFDTVRVRADGRLVPVSLTVSPVRDDAGRIVGASKIARDISERIRARDQLGESEERYRTLIEQVKEHAIFGTDTRGRAVTWNEGVRRVLGFEEHEFLGQDIVTAIFTPEDIASGAAERELETAARTGSANDDRWMRKKDGTRFWAAGITTARRDAAGRLVGFTKVMRDMTAQKRMQDELRQMAADLSEADRRKTEFLAMLAHELRNPLAPIRNAVQALRLTAGHTPAVASASALMERQVGQMVRLVDDLLDVSRVSRGKIELRLGRVELASVVHHAVEAARSLYQSLNHDLTVSLPPDPIHLHADPARLAQVVGNLLNNACKFTDKGGRIALTVRRDGDQAVIRVTDSGVGLAPDHLPRIFDLFVQVDTTLERSTSGLGIGLTLVKTLVEMHGGTVTVRSEGLGKGSEFEVRLPVPAATPDPPPPPADEAAPAPPRRVLVADPNRDSAESLAMLLDLTGHQTRTAFDGLAAVAVAEEFRPDVVLCDIGMPKLNGYEVARRIRERPWGKGVVLVALTGWGQEDDRRKSRDAGFDAHLVKPVDHPTLAKLLAERPGADSGTR